MEWSTIVVGVVDLAVYVYVARKYKLRERDEPCHVHRFVEDYYSKIQEEENYDHDSLFVFVSYWCAVIHFLK